MQQVSTSIIIVIKKSLRPCNFTLFYVLFGRRYGVIFSGYQLIRARHHVQLLLCCFIWPCRATKIGRHQKKYHTHSNGNDSPQTEHTWSMFSSPFSLFQIQFTIILIQCALSLAQGCDVPKLLFAIYVPNVLLIFLMFYDFFKKAYKKKTDLLKGS